MATKKTTTTKKAPAKKAAAKPAAKKAAAPKQPKEKKEAGPKAPRHPKGRVAAMGSKPEAAKEELAKQLAPSLARDNEDSDVLVKRLSTASNSQLLRLQSVVSTVKSKYGSREKLIDAIGTAQNKSKDKDYLAKLATLSLPQLLDLATTSARA